MSRVNHNQFRKLFNNERGRFRDRDLFSSRILAGYLEDIAAAQTGRYGNRQRIHVQLSWKPKSEEIASTDNMQIRINAGCELVTAKKTRQERFITVCGLFTHELGHILFTDFLCKQSYLLQMSMGNWYPERPKLTSPALVQHEKEIQEYCNESKIRKTLYLGLAKYIWNIIEDGFVEERILARFRGELGANLAALRASMWDTMPTVTQLTDNEDDARYIWHSVMQLMIGYSRFGDIRYGEADKNDERVHLLFSCLNNIDAALLDADPKVHWRETNEIMLRNWPYVKAYLEACEEHAQSEDDDMLSSINGSMQGSSQIGNGCNQAIAIGAQAPTSSTMAHKRQAFSAQAGSNSSQPEESEVACEVGDESDTGKNDMVPVHDETEYDQAPQQPDADGNTASDSDVSSGIGSCHAQQVIDNETGRLPYRQTGRIESPIKGGTEYDDGYDGSGYADAGKDLEKILDRMAESSLEKKRTQELNELAQTISYGDAHQDVKKTIHRLRDVDVEMIADYESNVAPLLKISKRLQQSIQRQLKDRRRGGKQTGLYMGRRLDTHAIARDDGRVFYKASLPNENPELAVGLLLDESGSMSSAKRATYARATAIILYDFCHSLGIPVLIYGHSTSNGVDLYSYAEFDEIDRMDKYRLMDISARGCNRDGAALRYMAERLSHRQEDLKLLIIVSDGQPNDNGYGGTSAEEDLRGIMQEYKRRGVHLVAAAIGDDKSNIERIYGDAFMDISDLEKMPILLTNIVKRNIHV